MPTRVNIDGRVLEPADARISIFDHGLLYGDSIYETLRTHDRRPFLFGEHFERLEEAASALHLTLPWPADRMRSEVNRTLEAAGSATESLVRIIVTRGVGDLTPDPEACPAPTVIILTAPLEEPSAELYRSGVAVVVSALRRDPGLASIKTGNLLHQVLGAREARMRGAAETIFLSTDGCLSDGTRTNIFLVRRGELATPSVDSGVVRGITRGIVIAAAQRSGVPFVEAKLPPDALRRCEEAFITSTTRGVMPVTRVDGEPVGDGAVGPLTHRLIEVFRIEAERLAAAEVLHDRA